jgi:CIC family chloride channel protein
MGATFAGIVRVPLTSVFMIFELTRDYAIVVPLMISNLVSFAISRRFQRVPVYEALALQDGIHLPRSARERGGSRTRVAHVMHSDVPVVDASTRIAEIPPHALACAVLRDEAPAAGLSRREIDRALSEGQGGHAAGSLLAGREDIPHLHLDHFLEDALERMYEAEVDAIAVVDRADTNHVAGVVTLQAVQRAFGAR